MADNGRLEFGIFDFACFFVILAIPPAIGIYFAWQSRKKQSMVHYFFGEKKMNPIAVGISSAVTCISAFTLIAYPAEAYIVGTTLFWAAISISVAAILTMFYYIPFFGNLQLPTVYSYLELRFNAATRRLVAIIATVCEIFYLGIAIYLPSVALNAVTPVSKTWSIILVGGVCTFYTAVGGIQAVIWTDVVQSVFMIFGCVMLLIKTLVSVGGIGNVTTALERGDRMTFFKFDSYDISSRIHPVTVLLGDFFIFSQYFGFTQAIYQRFLSCASTREARYSIAAFLLPSSILICVSIFNGLVMYTYFEYCDPIKSNLLSSYDQGLPYMALAEFEKMPGMAGVFVAAVFSGTLSTVSSFLNSCSIVVIEELAVIAFPNIGERVKVVCGKICAVLLGLVVVGFAYVISVLEKNTFKILRCVQGASNGAVFGIYLLGIYTPWANSLGAVVGGSVAYIAMIWMFLGSSFLLHAPPRVSLPPVSIEGCMRENSSLWLNNSIATPQTIVDNMTTTVSGGSENLYTFDQVVYSLNFHYYVLSGCLITVVLGLILSFLSGANEPSKANPELFMPLISNRYLPKRLRNFFRFGVPETLVKCVKNTMELEPLQLKE